MLQRGGSLALSGFGHAHHPSSGGGSSGSGGGSGGGSATAAAAAAAAGPPPVVKQMQNYLGIGVDAKASGSVVARVCMGATSVHVCPWCDEFQAGGSGPNR